MAQIFIISDETFNRFAKKVALDVVHKTTDNLYLKIQQMSPIRTGEYASQHRNMGVRIEGDLCIGEIRNEGGYSERVERGFGKGGGIGNRQTEVNWKLRNGTVYRGKGANVYKRAIEKTKPIFNQLLQG